MPRNDMNFKLHTPAFPLNRYIDQFIYYEGIDVAHSLDRFLPDGNTELIINLIENPQSIHDNDQDVVRGHEQEDSRTNGECRM